MSELTHLSYSSVSTYQLCARSWEYKYIKKIITPSSPSLVFGSAFHGCVEAIIRSRAAGEIQTPVEAIWTEQWNKAQQQEVAWNGELPEELNNLGLRMLIHKDTVSLLSSIEPMLDSDGDGNITPVIEKRVELHVPGVPISVIGFIDMIDSTGCPCDFKTAARMWTADKAKEETQPLFYHAALNQAGYTQNPGMFFRHFVFTKTRTPQTAVFTTQHTPAQLFWLFGAIRETWRSIEAGVFPPNPSSWKCSDKWCDHWGICRGRR